MATPTRTNPAPNARCGPPVAGRCARFVREPATVDPAGFGAAGVDAAGTTSGDEYNDGPPVWLATNVPASAFGAEALMLVVPISATPWIPLLCDPLEAGAVADPFDVGQATVG